MTMLEITRTRRCPTRSPIAPVKGAVTAEAYVRQPRKSPDANALPPRSRMRNGATGRSWKTDRNTEKLNPHITKKRGVNSRSVWLDMNL